jgi:protein-S-isoprenylcysteine O-methyltransferase
VRRLALIGCGVLAAAAMTYLGLATAVQNVLGWFLLFVGLGYFGGGAVYLALSNPLDGSLREAGERSLWLLAPGFAVVFFGAPLEWLFLPHWLPRAAGAQWIGVALIAAGLLLRAWTRLALGRQYRGRLQADRTQPLVRRGPFRYVRHPGYAGFVLLALGTAIGYSSVIGLTAITLLLLPGLAYRMRVEEALLVAAYGPDYRDYQRATKRLIPRLW